MTGGVVVTTSCLTVQLPSVILTGRVRVVEILMGVVVDLKSSVCVRTV